MTILCKEEQKPEIKNIIQAEIDKNDYSIYLEEDTHSICIDYVNELPLIEEIQEVFETIREMLTVIKDRFPDVEIKGMLEIGDDNYRLSYSFASPAGSKDVEAEDATMEAPYSKYWFPYWMTSDNYGPYLDGFVSREEFEYFMEYTRDFLKEKGVSFDLFLNSDLLEEFFEEDEEAIDEFPFSDFIEESKDFYISAWNQYQNELKTNTGCDTKTEELIN